MDEKTRTDVLEKIVEGPTSSTTVYVDDITDVRNVKNVTNISENYTDITDITNIKNVKNINEQLINNFEVINNVIDKSKTNRDVVEKISTLEDRTDNTVVRDRIDIHKKVLYEDKTVVTKDVSGFGSGDE